MREGSEGGRGEGGREEGRGEGREGGEVREGREGGGGGDRDGGCNGTSKFNNCGHFVATPCTSSCMIRTYICHG